MAKLRQNAANRWTHEELSPLPARLHKAIPATPRVRCGKRQAQGAARMRSHVAQRVAPPSHDACIATGNLGLRLEAFSLAPSARHRATCPMPRRHGGARTVEMATLAPDVSLSSRFGAVYFCLLFGAARVVLPAGAAKRRFGPSRDDKFLSWRSQGTTQSCYSRAPRRNDAFIVADYRANPGC